MTEAVPPISDEALDRIERGLEGVTGGPWMVATDLPAYAIMALNADGSGGHRVVQTPNQNNYRRYGPSDGWHGVSSVTNATHIANCDPDTIRSLIARLRASEAVKAEVVDRDAVIEECAALIEHGFPGVVGETYAADGVTRSKNDKCLHGRRMYEDCEQCCADAVRTLKSPALHPQRTP